MLIAFKCSSSTASRFFKASAKDPGPPVLYNKTFPNGKPLDQVDPKYHKELRINTKLLQRTVEIARLARLSPARTTIVWETPAGRGIKGTNQFSEDLSEHTTVFDTDAFKGLISSTSHVSPWSTSTFAWCRLTADVQKYTTFYYTNDAAPVLDQLNGPSFQCNHPEGTHARQIKGQLPDGTWASKSFTPFPNSVNTIIAVGSTYARTGTLGPIATSTPDDVATPPVVKEPPTPITSTSDSTITITPASLASPATTATPRMPATSATPRVPRSPSTNAPPRDALSPVTFQGFESSSPSSGYEPFNPSVREQKGSQPQGRAGRSVRSSTRNPESELSFQRELASRQLNLDRTASRRGIAQEPWGLGPGQLPSIVESPPPVLPPMPQESLDDIEAQVASLVEEAYGDSASQETNTFRLTDFFDVTSSHLTEKVSSLPQGKHVLAVEDLDLSAMLKVALSNDRTCRPGYEPVLHALLAGAGELTPTNHKEAMNLGQQWVRAEEKELSNHNNNSTWEVKRLDEIPKGRRLHKLVWVFKIKRNGTYKARLCVQGCTMVEGKDFDQVWAGALRSASARSLFAYAARHGCSVQSIDWVAAYLQGELLEGENVFCHMPPGHELFDKDGQPLKLKIVKPIYGIPQGARRFQRSLFPWLRARGFHQLDDSDPSIWVWDPNRPVNANSSRVKLTIRPT